MKESQTMTTLDDIAARDALDVETLAEWLHELDGTQHYVIHERDYDGEDMEIVQCIGGPDDHLDDARALLLRLTEGSDRT